jgi:hypothetical protein
MKQEASLGREPKNVEPPKDGETGSSRVPINIENSGDDTVVEPVHTGSVLYEKLYHDIRSDFGSKKYKEQISKHTEGDKKEDDAFMELCVGNWN